MKDNITVVLVNFSHPGNIGAAARAMKVMGLTNLCLVAPKSFPSAVTTAMAAGADDLLEQASVVHTLEEAIANCQVVFATSARIRALSLPLIPSREAAVLVSNYAKTSKVAILFGRENNGLSNQELALCNYQIYIPTTANFTSLNVAAAVQLIAYELNLASQETINFDRAFDNSNKLATAEELQSWYNHLTSTLLKVDFLNENNKAKTMLRLHRIFNRSRLEQSEVSLLRGILTSVEYKLKKDN